MEDSLINKNDQKENLNNINKTIISKNSLSKEKEQNNIIKGKNNNKNSKNEVNKIKNNGLKYKNNSKVIKNDIKKKKKISQENTSYLNRFINYEKKKEEKISEMKKEMDIKEKIQLKQKPYISRKSVELASKIHLKDDFLERLEDEDKKSKIKKEKLIEKIKNERAKKKKEEEKPLEFNIKQTIVDKKFDKIYQEMLKKEEFSKEKLIAFADMVDQYKMRECIFQPNINRDEENNEEKKRKKRLNSAEITQRLYNDELKNMANKRENLEQKYKYSFKPTIGEKSLELALKRKKKIDRKDKEKFVNIKKRMNNSLDKNSVRHNKTKNEIDKE